MSEHIVDDRGEVTAEVIRCKDCRKHNKIHGQDWCKESARYVEPECFCSWAERREQ